jgi:hypothetical protein
VSRFIGLAIFIAIVAGLAIHAGVELPWFLDWIGKLPGDLLIKKAGMTIYVPLTSSLVISAIVSGFLSIFSRG